MTKEQTLELEQLEQIPLKEFTLEQFERHQELVAIRDKDKTPIFIIDYLQIVGN